MAWIAPSAVPLQILVAVAVAGLGIWLDPARSSARRSTAATTATSARACTAGSSARRCSPSTPSATRRGPGHVRLAGERWLAVSGGDQPIPAGTKVIVTAVAGTTLIVWPLDGVLPHAEGEP